MKKKESKEEPKKIVKKASKTKSSKIEEQKGKKQKNEEIKVKDQKIEENLNKENNENTQIDNKNQPKEEKSPPEIKNNKDVNKTSEIKNPNKLPKSLLSKKTEENYILMTKYFKKDNYKRRGDNVIHSIINYEDYSNDKYLTLDDTKINNKNIIDEFIKRNQDDIKLRQENNKNINTRIKLINDSTNKKLYFNNRKSQKEYFDSFYNKQIQYKNSYKDHLDKLSKKYDEELKKNFVPELKNHINLNYFKNNEPVEISKYCFKSKQSNKINNNNINEIIKENNNENDNENAVVTLRAKKDKPENTKKTNYNRNLSHNNINNYKNNSSNKNDNGKNKRLKKIKSHDMYMKKEIKLTKKEIGKLTNKLHYDGELSKIKKQIKISENIKNNSNNNDNNSKEKLSHSSIIILIRKLLFDYSTSIKKNTYTSYKENPKLNYDQYIDILKDLYYLEKDSLPEDFLDEDTMYKELWNKLIQFSNGPENSIESNVFLLYLLELNGYFNNEKIIKELKNEIYWINLEEYDDLIANAKYIEENWDDLKNTKIENIKKLKLEGNYKSKHSQDLFNNKYINYKKNIYINLDSSIDNDNHYITTLKGNTNYHVIHGYNTKNKNNGNNNSFDFSNSFDNKNEENKGCSFSISNLSNKNIKNRIPLRDSYNDLIVKRKTEIENKKKDEEKKLKEICTFKPQIININKNLFTKKVKIELPKYKRNKSVNIYNNSPIQESNTINNNNIEQNALTMTLHNIDNNTIHNSINEIKGMKSINGLKRNKSSLKKMFEDNPLKNDKTLNDKIQKLKMVKLNGKENDNYILAPMRFDIEYPSKFESMGLTINKEANRLKTQNVIFYNIKVNDEMKTLKYIEGDNLELNVINFVNKNKLPKEVTNIILKKIKEKTLEEIY